MKERDRKREKINFELLNIINEGFYVFDFCSSFISNRIDLLNIFLPIILK